MAIVTVVSPLNLPTRQLKGVVVAAGFIARLRGWFGYQQRQDINAIWLVRTRCIHTIGMRMPVDLVWMDNNGVCIRVEHKVSPGCLCWCDKACQVLELRCQQLTVQSGDQCIIHCTQG
ncbi:hypothetical protein CWE12_03685 [Aliidiomarina sedimenti]|uniref:DUF192 domain-containing protein n=1 Tax=Aliidiomarina sedimenti TaxID=1933879 RepID=A0ABY0C3Q6_9GAMM|nr:DUF192 domain-containing protein [Aliidiomarina sedimenti]RUO32103.1 hypothetical protein CWE12_03685 [Aliidiomarina sedimenti]